MRRLVPLLLFVLAAACEPVVMPAPPPQAPTAQSSASDREIRGRAARAARQFVQVVETVEPVAEAECRRVEPRMNCDFQIVVDDRPGQPPNAFQTVANVLGLELQARAILVVSNLVLFIVVTYLFNRIGKLYDQQSRLNEELSLLKNDLEEHRDDR